MSPCLKVAAEKVKKWAAILANRGKAAQVDPIKIRVESAYAVSA